MVYSEESVSKILGRSLYPSASLSNEDLLHVLLNRINAKVTQVKDSLEECMRDDRNHFKKALHVAIAVY